MFSTRALENLNARGRSPSSYLQYVRDVCDEARGNVLQLRALAFSVVRFSALAQAAVLVLLAPAYVPGRTDELLRLGVVSALACVLIVVVLVAHIGMVGALRSGPVPSLGAANRLTIARFILVAPVVLLIIDGHFVYALAAYAVCAGTDVVDGIVARRRNDHTEFGVVMDPVADIVSTASVFGALLARGLVPTWVVAVLAARYASLFLGVTVLFFTVGPMKFRATLVGKIVGVLQAAAVIMILALTALGLEWAERIGPFLFPFLGAVFSAVIVSQLVIGVRHVRRNRENA